MIKVQRSRDHDLNKSNREPLDPSSFSSFFCFNSMSSTGFFSFPLISITFLITLSALSFFPLTRSHLGDSGTRPGTANRAANTMVGTEMPSCRWSHRGRAQAIRGTVRYPRAQLYSRPKLTRVDQMPPTSSMQ